MSRVIGYARVSTEDQNLDMQQLAIEKYAKEHNMELILYVKSLNTQNRAHRIAKCTESSCYRRSLCRI